MNDLSRRGFLAGSPVVAAVAATKPTRTGVRQQGPVLASPADELDLCSTWQFRTGPGGNGEKEAWQSGKESASGWQPVAVPHTWQIQAPFVDYRGDAWYTKSFAAPQEWVHKVVRIEFEAVFHSATVWINGKLAGDHLRKGYTAFTFDISRLLSFGQNNTIAVRVNNAFDEHMLPRGHSSDWAHDGGIFRPVRLLITDRVYVERVDVDTHPDFANGTAELNITAFVRSAVDTPVSGDLTLRIIDDETGDIAVQSDGMPFRISQPGMTEMPLRQKFDRVKFWHFDHPHLYRLELAARSAEGAHLFVTTFGVRRLEVRDGAFFLNNEKVVLAGVERMAGSNPEFGMAEPLEWIEHDHRDLKHLNCIFTRVHWPQDKSVLDFCDRHGILMQEEVPAWGPLTFAGMSTQPDSDLMQNGIDQLHEMVARDRNHPCIVSWGLCNEINGQNPPAYAFAKAMLAEVKKIDASRLCSYASHSLFKNQAKDVSGLMDFVECNQYIGSWQPGGPVELDHLLDEIHAAFPEKPIVISEYGYCACTADRPEGDGHRVAVLADQNEVLRRKPFVCGAIFFCYNDYRTHVGDRGVGVMKQRVHGVVDLYGAEKPSYALLRIESSPIAALTFENYPSHVVLHVTSAGHFPSYTLRAYTVRALYFGPGDIPIHRVELSLPELAPGLTATLQFDFEKEQPERIVFDVLRPTRYSASTLVWLR
jgi:beta-galactosidase